MMLTTKLTSSNDVLHEVNGVNAGIVGGVV